MNVFPALVLLLPSPCCVLCVVCCVLCAVLPPLLMPAQLPRPGARSSNAGIRVARIRTWGVLPKLHRSAPTQSRWLAPNDDGCFEEKGRSELGEEAEARC